MNRKLWLICLSLGVLVFAMAFAACGDDDDDDAATADPAQASEVEDIATKLLETDPTSDADMDYFLGHITAQGLKYFGYESADDCKANAADCIGDPSQVVSFAETTVSGDNASTLATTTDGEVKVVLAMEGDTWKLNGYALTAKIPDGVTTVDISAVDYGYDWDKSKVGDGNVAFAMKNDGSEAHEIALVSVEDDFDPQVVIDGIESGELDQNSLPPGVIDFVGFAIATPGETANAVIDGGLEAGKYAFICFLPDSEGKPHIVHGMYSEFAVE